MADDALPQTHASAFRGTVSQLLAALRHPSGSATDKAIKTAAADEIERLSAERKRLEEDVAFYRRRG